MSPRTPPEPAPPSVRASRLTSVDVFRGLTVAGMLLVNNPGDAAHVFAPLQHSVWHGWTVTDLIFPFFLFIVGVTTELSLARRAAAGDDYATVHRAMLRRAVVLFALGLLVNGFPFYRNATVAGPAWLPAPIGHVASAVANLRIMGVLQRIALTYLVASLVAWKGSTRRIVLAATLLLLGYWAAMTLLPVPGDGVMGWSVLSDPARNLSAWVDRSTLDWTRAGLGWHLWDVNVPYDPEGLFSTIPAIGTVLFGVLAGRWMQSPRDVSERLSSLAAFGALAMVAGAVWSWWFPINKPIWTSSYVLFSAGVACVALSAVAWFTDGTPPTRGASPAVSRMTSAALAFGLNPIVAYVGSELLASVLRSSIKWPLDGRHVGTGQAVALGFEALGVETRMASLLWAILFVALWYVILRQLSRKGIVFRV